jgi:predicted HNH restriction endonuclease
MAECPTCGKSFDGDMGVKTHHKQVHGKSIAGEVVNCDNCGGEVRKKKYLLERSEKHYCSPECQYNHREESWEGSKHPHWSKEKKVCKECGDNFLVHRYRSDRAKFCSHTCYHKNMEGDKDTKYGSNWSYYQQMIREEYSHKCFICDKKCGDKHHDVHHIIPVAEFDAPSNANYEENLVLLCKEHHGKFENLTVQEQIERLNSNPVEYEV